MQICRFFFDMQMIKSTLSKTFHYLQFFRCLGLPFVIMVPSMLLCEIPPFFLCVCEKELCISYLLVANLFYFGPILFSSLVLLAFQPISTPWFVMLRVKDWHG